MTGASQQPGEAGSAGCGARCGTLACASVTCCREGLSGFKLEQHSLGCVENSPWVGMGVGRGSLRQLYRNPGRGGG